MGAAHTQYVCLCVRVCVPEIYNSNVCKCAGDALEVDGRIGHTYICIELNKIGIWKWIYVRYLMPVDVDRVAN